MLSYDKVAKEEVGTTGSEENSQEEEVLFSNTKNLLNNSLAPNSQILNCIDGASAGAWSQSKGHSLSLLYPENKDGQNSSLGDNLSIHQLKTCTIPASF